MMVYQPKGKKEDVAMKDEVKFLKKVNQLEKDFKIKN